MLKIVFEKPTKHLETQTSCVWCNTSVRSPFQVLTEDFIECSKQISHLPELTHLGRDLASTLFLKEKVERAFLHANWDHGNFKCQECTTVSGLTACGHLKCWRVKREKLEDWSRGCAIHIFRQLHCAENTCDVAQSGYNWTGSKSQSSTSAA